MGWLVSGALYAIGYSFAAAFLSSSPATLGLFRACALAVPPLAATIVIITRRRQWHGCEWLFWSTIGLGLVMSAIGLGGWAASEAIAPEATWLSWPAVFALFGGGAPLFALLAQPHRGAREPVAATTAVDIAGLAVVTGFLYSFFVTAPVSQGTNPLLLVSEAQQILVTAGLIGAAFAARGTPWRDTYRRLALGAFTQLALLSLGNFEAGRGLYRTADVFDLTWILPYAFFPWAASAVPAPDDDERAESERIVASDEAGPRPRPWVMFGVLATIPLIDLGLRHLLPSASSSARDISTAVTLISVFPLLVARIAAERAELQQADGTMRILTQVIEQAQDLILVLTPDGRVRHANQAFCRAMGVPREELMTLQSANLMARDTVSADDIERSVQNGGTWRGTVTRTRRDGTTFPVSAAVAALRDDRGHASYIVSVERDISEEKRLREQLIHSERLSAVGGLVAGVAHELNNPLQSVMGYTDLLLREEQRPGVRSDLEQVLSEAERAAKIVKNLMTFVRHSALERSLVDLGEAARSTIVLKKADFQNLGITLTESYAADVPLVAANREEVRHVILNLLSNAEHAVQGMGKPGAIRVQTGAASGFAYIEISDNGPGVPQDMAGRIFEPFFTTKTIGQGTGLGLSTSLGIAEAHGGSLSLARSEAGACFLLTLPLAAATTNPAKALTGQKPITLDVNAPGLARTPRVLIVEDEEVVRQFVDRSLQLMGYETSVAGDGHSAMELLDTEAPFDLLVTDLQMPGLRGDELANIVRTRQPGLKVLYVTGFSSQLFKRRGALLDGEAFLEKPIAASGLVEAVSQLLYSSSIGIPFADEPVTPA